MDMLTPTSCEQKTEIGLPYFPQRLLPSVCPKKIFLARSRDGQVWDISPEPLLESSDRNYLDPGAVQTGPGEWLVILSTVELDKALTGPYDYVSAILREQ